MEDTFLFNTTGFSMWPFLMPETRLIIKRTAMKDLQRGDIVLYKRDGAMICHRVIKKINCRDGRLLVYIRGDNSISQSEPVTQEMVLGKVVGIMRNDNIVDITKKRRVFINKVIVIIAPFICRMNRIVKPWYDRLCRNKSER